MSAPSIADLEVNHKDSFQVVLYVANSTNGAANLSGYTVAGKYKKDYFAPDSQANSFTAEVSNAANGEITLSLTPTQTANLQVQQRYVYDVAVTHTGTGFKTRVLEGKLIVSPGVT